MPNIGTQERTGIGSRLVRVYVWQLPVRLAHWIIVLDLIVLSFTGVYTHDPFLVSVGGRAYVMGIVRFIHLTAGFLLICAFIWRFYWFFAGNRWARWPQFVPLRRARRAGMSGMLKYYGFLRWWPVSEVGHNALAGSAYSAVYGLGVVEILTGLALLDNISGNRILHLFIGWLPRLLDLQYLRAIHFGAMFLFGVFLIHHVYSAILISKEEKSGLMESIFTGYKFVRESKLPPELRDSVPEKIEH